MPRLIIVHHAPTPNTAALRDAMLNGATDDAIKNVDVVVVSAQDTSASDINGADAVLLLTPANFGYMAGLMKDLFDRTFLDIGGALADDGSGRAANRGTKLWGLCVHGRYDTIGAIRSVEGILAALPWTQAAPVLSVLGDVTSQDASLAYELGATVSALVGA